MDNTPFLWMKRHHVELAVIPALETLLHVNVSADEVPLELIPFSKKLLEVIVCHYVGDA